MSHDYIYKLEGPNVILEARRLIGVKEIPGPKHNKEIMAWADEVEVDYNDDETPWCGLFVAVVMKRAAKPVVKGPLWARGWLNWGNVVKGDPVLGDLLVFDRGKGKGHVGFYVGEDKTAYHVLGGNQGNEVSIDRIEKSRLLGVRNFYAKAQPAYCKRIFVSSDGALSTNEA